MDRVHSGGGSICFVYKQADGIKSESATRGRLFRFVTDSSHRVTVLPCSRLCFADFCTISSWVFKSVTIPSRSNKSLLHAVVYCEACLLNLWIILLFGVSMVSADPGKSTAYFLSRDHVCETHPNFLRAWNH